MYSLNKARDFSKGISLSFRPIMCKLGMLMLQLLALSAHGIPATLAASNKLSGNGISPYPPAKIKYFRPPNATPPLFSCSTAIKCAKRAPRLNPNIPSKEPSELESHTPRTADSACSSPKYTFSSLLHHVRRRRRSSSSSTSTIELCGGGTCTPGKGSHSNGPSGASAHVPKLPCKRFNSGRSLPNRSVPVCRSPCSIKIFPPLISEIGRDDRPSTFLSPSLPPRLRPRSRARPYAP
mmetsp:Transcript_18055/g.41069  ORF Transcript_18055/g.41069 Transcript_18055/m.41069 type:complete len:237 (-) Transcript_18055:167-877(-)